MFSYICKACSLGLPKSVFCDFESDAASFSSSRILILDWSSSSLIYGSFLSIQDSAEWIMSDSFSDTLSSDSSFKSWFWPISWSWSPRNWPMYSPYGYRICCFSGKEMSWFLRVSIIFFLLKLLINIPNDILFVSLFSEDKLEKKFLI